MIDSRAWALVLVVPRVRPLYHTVHAACRGFPARGHTGPALMDCPPWFTQVCDGPVLREMLRDDELELLVCGLPHLDFEALHAAARYEGGFSAEHPTVQSFWRVLKGLPLDKKKRFLAFATGSDRCGNLHSTFRYIERPMLQCRLP